MGARIRWDESFITYLLFRWYRWANIYFRRPTFSCVVLIVLILVSDLALLNFVLVLVVDLKLSNLWYDLAEFGTTANTLGAKLPISIGLGVWGNPMKDTEIMSPQDDSMSALKFSPNLVSNLVSNLVRSANVRRVEEATLRRPIFGGTRQPTQARNSTPARFAGRVSPPNNTWFPPKETQWVTGNQLCIILNIIFRRCYDSTVKITRTKNFSVFRQTS